MKTYYIHPAAFGSTNPGYGHVPVVKADEAEKRVAELEAMLARLYAECDTGERRGNGSQSGVAMPSWVTVEAARLLLGVK
ncbi:hypothetical protein [Enterobacter quasiroggenkampii]|uniref:hypothetical protein n=1 Tax=Enterobacter quasiroggenkampii TaxID=2497436 RepID=UPI0021CF4A3F|nr:hypothetical protein [Enterobacter quasiroggenkampii]MCU6407868.1 hypothetical protein [Enterobacter quasiroggenkampii]